jgi:hypothetical protein
MKQVTEDCAIAVLSKMQADSKGPALWCAKYVEEFAKEQPHLMYIIAENIRLCFAPLKRGEANEIAEVAAGSSLYVALMTYNIIKSAVEAEELENLFSEGETDVE